MNNIQFVGEHSKTFDVQWHSHEQWEVIYCTGGEGTILFENGTTMNYKAGDAVAIPPRELHANSSQEGFTNIYLQMSDPSFPYRSAFRVEDDAQGHLKIAFAEARFYFLADIKKRELVLSALGELIASYMIVYRSNSEFSKPVEQIRAMIIGGYAQCDFQLDEAIRSMPFHYDYLRKLFKKEMGVTPLEYMTSLRMKKAETMLSAMHSNDYSVAEIGELCGFDDALYFSRVFKKYFGCSPSVFAKQGAKADADKKSE
jgi:AraC-like DNA-binding protein